MLRIVGVLCFAFLLSCATPTAEIMDSWKGSHVSRLIKSWGPAQRIADDGQGGKIYIYSNVSHTSVTVPFKPFLYSNPYGIITKSKTNERTRMFWVNTDGIIYYWKAEGDINEKHDLSGEGMTMVYAVLLVIALMGAAGAFSSSY